MQMWMPSKQTLQQGPKVVSLWELGLFNMESLHSHIVLLSGISAKGRQKTTYKQVMDAFGFTSDWLNYDEKVSNVF